MISGFTYEALQGQAEALGRQGNVAQYINQRQTSAPEERAKGGFSTGKD